VQFVQLICKLTRLIDELEKHARESDEYAARLRAEIDVTRAEVDLLTCAAFHRGLAQVSSGQIGGDCLIKTEIYAHNGCQLTCTAVADDNGKFEVAVVASRVAWPSRPRVIAVERVRYVSIEAALESGRRLGIKWVMDHG